MNEKGILKAAELTFLGFKKKSLGSYHWYEKKISKARGDKNVKLMTNDSFFNKDKDEWFVGIQIGSQDTLWLPSKTDFNKLFLLVKSLMDIYE